MEIRLGDFKTTAQHRKVINDILDNGRITEGKYVKLFEEAVEKFLGVKHAIAVTNGTVALQLVAQYINHISTKKQTVCIPATTFPATINAFLLNGFKVILCDIDEKTLCMDVDNLTWWEKQQIDVIVPVHLMGYTCDMDKINKMANKYNWIVVEDFAEAFGSKYKGIRVGSMEDFGCSSFFMSHIIQGGELGIVTTNNTEAYKVMKKMKNHGRHGDPMQFEHKYIGSNYKTTEFCAGICYTQLKTADKAIKKRQDNAKYLYDNIKNFVLEPYPVGNNFSFLGYPIKAYGTASRKIMCEMLNRKGIETRGIFPCLANQEAYKGMFKKKYSVSEEVERDVFYIPCHQYLKKNELKKMVEVLSE